MSTLLKKPDNGIDSQRINKKIIVKIKMNLEKGNKMTDKTIFYIIIGIVHLNLKVQIRKSTN